MKIHSYEFCRNLLGWRQPTLATANSAYSSDCWGPAGASCAWASPASSPGPLAPSAGSSGVEFSWEMPTSASGWSSVTWLELASSFPSEKKKNVFVAIVPRQSSNVTLLITVSTWDRLSLTFIQIVTIVPSSSDPEKRGWVLTPSFTEAVALRPELCVRIVWGWQNLHLINLMSLRR